MEEARLDRCLQTRRFTTSCLSHSAEDFKCQEMTVKSWSSSNDLDSDQPKMPLDKPEKQAIVLNVGGKVFHITIKNALKYPNTREKTALSKLCDDYSLLKNEFFFDRDPAIFLYISHFYTSGVLWVSQEMCPISFEEEVEYWGLSLSDTQLCCWLLFEEKVGDVKERLEVERDLLAETQVQYHDEHFKDMMFRDVRQMLWNLTENPYSSTLAKAFSLVSNLCVLISIVAIALETVAEIQIYKINGKSYMEWVEIFTIIFFIFEYFARLATTPHLKVFIKGGLNFVYLLAIPYFLQVIFENLFGLENVDTRQDMKAMAQVVQLGHLFKVVKLLRVFRILKLARHSTGMRAFGFTLKRCSQEVCCIFLFIGLGIFTFSALLHSVERDTEGSPITSIPYAWWWAAFFFMATMRYSKKTLFFLVAGLGALILLYIDARNSEEKFKKRVQTDVEEKLSETAPKVNSYVYSGPKCEQNTSAANISGFNTLPAHIQNFLYHRHCRHFPMLLDIPDKCGGPEKSSDVFLLLVVKSSPGNYERREVLRKTWAEERQHDGLWVRRVFIAGKAGHGMEKVRLDKLLRHEQKLYNDILQWDFEDSFFNLTLKQILFLEWMERNCPNARFQFNGDDDVFANTDNMVEYLHNLEDNDGGKHLFTGHLIHHVGPIRTPSSKYYVPVQVEESNSYPSYCGGGGFLLSGYTASVIYNMSKSIGILPIDDVYMGMCLAKAGLRPESHAMVKTAGLYIPSKVDGLDPCFYREVLLVHRFLPMQIFLMWHQIHNPDLHCSNLFKIPKYTIGELKPLN